MGDGEQALGGSPRSEGGKVGRARGLGNNPAGGRRPRALPLFLPHLLCS